MHARILSAIPLGISLGFSALQTVQAQMYKCEVDGKVEFSDQPCGDNGGEAVDLKYHNPDPSEAKAAEMHSATTEADLELSIQRRRLERQIRTAEQRISKLRADRDRELQQLREKKATAANDLAGATWQQSVSEEMSVIATRYSDEISVKQSEIARLREDLRSLGN